MNLDKVDDKMKKGNKISTLYLNLKSLNPCKLNFLANVMKSCSKTYFLITIVLILKEKYILIIY